MLLLVLLLATALSTLIVNRGLRKTRLFATEWFFQHKGMVIALLGDILFSLFLFASAQLSENTFIVRSSKMMGEFAWLIAAIFTSMIIRLDRRQNKATIKAYLPTLILAFIVIYFRIIFIPNSVINLVYPALVLGTTVWQILVNRRQNSRVSKADSALLWTGAGVMTVATLISWAGVVMGSLLLLIWWMFQLALLESIIAVTELLSRYYESTVRQRKSEYRLKNPALPLSSAKGSFIEVSWLYDLLRMALVPLLGIWSFPYAVYLACSVFNFNSVAHDLFFHPMVSVEDGFQLSLFMVLMVISLFFVFRYIVYAGKAFFRVWKTRSVIEKLGDGVVFKETDINFNLVNNILSLVAWGLYVVIIFLMLRIPASGLALVSTGLATGIGFAMKDILNNFFYGVQLMGGRVRVGDIVECDGIRGTVVGLSYQSTQIEAVDGSVIIFTNTALFNQNFKNLTRSNSYQVTTITVGVKYGTDVERARRIVQEAVSSIMKKDKYGREIIDRKKDVSVRLQNFGDSSVDLLVIMHVLVDSYASITGAAREAIYKAFNEQGIEIPFPQQDVYIKETPKP